MNRVAQPTFTDSRTARTDGLRRAKQLAPWVLMLGVMALMAHFIDLHAAVAALAHLTPGAIVLATLFYLLDRFSMSFKWNILLRYRGYWLSHWDAFRLYLASGFVGYGIPAAVGGDIFRAARLAVTGRNASKVSATIVLERVLGLLAILAVSWVGLLYIVVAGRTDLTALCSAVSAALLLGSLLTAISMSDGLYRLLTRATTRFSGNRIVTILHSLHDEYVALSKGTRPLAWFFFLSIVNQLIRTIMCVPVLDSLGVNVDFLELLALLPLSKALAQFSPVPAGIGVAEGAQVAALTLAHVPPSQALAVALVLRAIELATLLPAGLAYALDAWYLRKVA
ncbi:MAG TPA: lysylphosphatidylglycerol synthase transmembrane domain-containing protein [Steroidobacteraceae bacterium]